MAEYIDATPTWSGILPVLLTVLHDGNLEGKRMAGEELRRMARLADSLNEAMREATEWEQRWEEARHDLDICIAALIDMEDVNCDPLEVARAARARLTGQ